MPRRRVRAPLLALCLALPLTACTPGVIGDVASDAADRAVRSAVDQAVDSLVRRTVDRIAQNLFDTIIAGAIDSAFGLGGEIEFGPDFALDLYSGSYELSIEGDAPFAGSYFGEPIDPNDPEAAEQGAFSVGLRGTTDEGADFTGASLVHADDAGEVGFVVTYARVEDEGEREEILGLSFEDGEEALTGEVELVDVRLSGDRFAATIPPTTLTSEDGRSVVVSGRFDVPINPAGTFFIRGGAVEPAGKGG